VRDNADYRWEALAFTLNIAVPTVLFFSLINYFSGHQWLGLMELAVGLILMPILLIRRKKHLLPVFETLLMVCATLLFASLWIEGGIAKTGIYWVFVYPFAAFYITGLRAGWMWTGGFIAVLLAGFWARLEGLLVLPYNNDELFNFGCAFVFYVMMAGISEYLREYWQEELIALNNRLSQEAEDRREAQEARMQAEAQLLHDDKLKSLGMLAGGIAHDFNHLLGVMMSSAEMTRMEARPASKLAHNMIQIEESCKRAAELCTQLSFFAGRNKINLHNVSLNDIARESTALLRSGTDQNAQIKLHLAPGIPVVRVDVPQLHQAIGSLIRNASEAIDAGRDEGEGIITLTTGTMRADRYYLDASLAYEALPEGNYVFIEVSDTGCGMNAEMMSHIFDPFFTARKHGRGMGLSVVLGVMRGHQGAIHVESEEGTGSRFRILLPPAEAKQVTPAFPVENWRGAGLVLVVDGDDLVRKLSCHMLKKIGFETMAVSDGKQAIASFKEKADKLVAVILGYSIPDMNGGKVFLTLHDVRASVPVILCSSFTRQDVLDRFRAQGVAGFLHKPFSHVQLQAVLRDVLKKS